MSVQLSSYVRTAVQLMALMDRGWCFGGSVVGPVVLLITTLMALLLSPTLAPLRRFTPPRAVAVGGGRVTAGEARESTQRNTGSAGQGVLLGRW